MLITLAYISSTVPRKGHRSRIKQLLVLFCAAQAMGVLTIQPKSSQILSGESVTLRCNIQRGEVTDWKYTWRKDDVESISRKHEYEISEIKISDSGDYRNGLKHSQTRQAKAVLTIHPKSSQIFSGESVTFRCIIQRGEVTDWEYTWRKDDVDSISRKHEYEMSEVKISDNGVYRCLGKHIDNRMYSKWSDAVRLTVTGKSSYLSFTSLPPYSVTLSCGVKESSTGWRFFWYRTVPYTAGGTTEDSYTLISAGPSHTGGYVCRAGRGDPVYDTLYSEPQFLWSGGSVVSIFLLPRLLCSLLVVSPFLLVSIMLMVKCCRARGDLFFSVCIDNQLIQLDILLLYVMLLYHSNGSCQMQIEKCPWSAIFVKYVLWKFSPLKKGKLTFLLLLMDYILVLSS
uniref:Ig-like domain-containing protein n=1 Tax=Salmo trutta TaxID=8032 RepID=A0A674C7D1_SALTR